MNDITSVNSSDGFTPYLIGFYVDTEHGWVGAYDKRAIESMIAAVREKALHEAADDIERLRADRRTLTDQLRHIRTHLYAATVQRSPADDRIIADHIEQAYLRANEVIREMERTDD